MYTIVSIKSKFGVEIILAPVVAYGHKWLLKLVSNSYFKWCFLKQKLPYKCTDRNNQNRALSLQFYVALKIQPE